MTYCYLRQSALSIDRGLDNWDKAKAWLQERNIIDDILFLWMNSGKLMIRTYLNDPFGFISSAADMSLATIKKGGSSLSINIQSIDIINKISDILAGDAKRDDVSEWAFNMFDDDSLRFDDPVVLKYLKLLGAVDLPSSDRDFLYTDDDLRHWITEIEHQ